MKKFDTNAVGISLLVIFSIVSLSLPAIAFSSPAPINLGTSDNFAILAGSAVTGTGTNSVTGDVGLSSTTGAAITLLTCSELTGISKIYDVDNAYVGGGNPDVSCLNNPFDGTAATAKVDLALAYADAASAITHPVDSTIATDLIGQTLTTGVYNSASGTFENSGTLTLDAEGDPTHIFIFKMTTTLITSSSSHVVLINGAKASNVFWVVGSSATLGSSSDLTGTIMAVASITLGTSATVTGRLLADADNNIAGAVTLDGANTVLLDTTAPTSTITSPGDSSYSTSTTVALTGTSADTNLSSTTISVDGGSFVTTAGTAAAWTYSAIGLAQGAHTFQSKATDSSGNTGLSATINVTVDTVAPTVGIGLGDNALKISETSLLTFTFSEPVTGFTVADITGFPNGTLSAFTATGDPLVYTTLFTPSLTTEDLFNVITVGVGWTDVAGTAPIATTDSANYAVDTTAPSVALSSPTSNPTNGLIAVTAEFSENVTLFISTDIVIGNGAVENFIAVDGNTYTFNVNPSDGASVAVTIDVPITTSIDVAGNANTASNQLAYTSDTIAPTVGIVLGDNALKISDTSLLTFNFSEPVTGFTIADITGFPNGTLSAFTATGDPLVYTTLFTPSLTTEDLFNVITVGIGWTDVAGTAPIATTDSANYAVDTIAPTVTIDAPSVINNANKTAYTLTGTCSENTRTVTVTVAGIAPQTPACASLAWTTGAIDVSAAADSLTLAITADHTDAAGNNAIQATASVVKDTLNPTVTITSGGVTALKKGETATITFTLSESSVNFIEGDVVVAGGLLSAWTPVSGTSYTATFTPTDDSVALATIDVAGSTFTDAAGNNNTVATQKSMTVDTIRPLVDISIDKYAFKVSDTAVVTFTFSEAVTGFTNTDIGIANGTFSAGVSSLDGGITWTATFTPTNDLEDPTNFMSVDVTGVLDLAGNAGVGTAGSLNYTIDTRPPTVTVTDDVAGTVTSGNVNYTFTFSEPVTGFDTTDVTVSGGTKGAFATTSSTVYTLVVTPNASSTTNITVDIVGSAAIDAAGNDNTAATQSVQAVNTIVPPTPSSGGGGGGSLIQPKIVSEIGISKVPSSLILPAGTDDITYDYTVWNIKGKQSLIKISVTDDICNPIIYLSGDLNNNGKLDPPEKWKYSCSTTLSKTTTNTSTVIGYNGTSNKAITATATSTVVVENTVLPSLSAFPPTPKLPNTGFSPQTKDLKSFFQYENYPLLLQLLKFRL